MATQDFLDTYQNLDSDCISEDDSEYVPSSSDSGDEIQPSPRKKKRVPQKAKPLAKSAAKPSCSRALNKEDSDSEDDIPLAQNSKLSEIKFLRHKEAMDVAHGKTPVETSGHVKTTIQQPHQPTQITRMFMLQGSTHTLRTPRETLVCMISPETDLSGLIVYTKKFKRRTKSLSTRVRRSSFT
ncbi:hypothetical protein ElyMa_005602200 [Elysia marginata]|uniref:Uncharacterized protein n=1 Tax=Elysia marginata TaxID=1093978 RepID=A0AAV4F5B1_9GAST|nr:hypothetical protein ElyMa_005602200 [Elysia marginata]